MLIRIRRDWEIRESDVTPESAYVERRRFLRTLGAAGAGLLAGGLVLAGEEGDGKGGAPGADEKKAGASGTDASRSGTGDGDWKRKLYPAKRNEKYTLDRPITDEAWATGYNNFYEFSFNKAQVRHVARGFKTEPWKIEVTGLVKKPRTLDVDDLLRMFPLEERLYRFRCVEAWAMAVPWAGFPLKSFVEKMEPLGSAKYLRMLTFLRPEQAPMQRYELYPWPYFEGLRLDEATNELAILATGIYGKPMPNQNGAPLRLIVPWKYGFKSIKSIVKFEFTEKRPPTFWNALIPDEYDFMANVDPAVPHPRWSQAHERMIGTDDGTGNEVIRPTQPYNGYAKQVAHLYRRGT